jgi:hypothetical protein
MVPVSRSGLALLAPLLAIPRVLALRLTNTGDRDSLDAELSEECVELIAAHLKNRKMRTTRRQDAVRDCDGRADRADGPQVVDNTTPPRALPLHERRERDRTPPARTNTPSFPSKPQPYPVGLLIGLARGNPFRPGSICNHINMINP